MTLPSNCLPAEPSTAPSDPRAGFGTSPQTPTTPSGGTPFASLLTQADTTGANGGAPTGGSALADAASAPPAANTPAAYPGAYYMAYGGQPGGPAGRSGAASAALQVQAQPAGPGVPPAGAEATVESVAETLPGTLEAPAKGKQKGPTNPKETSKEQSLQGATLLAYQFIAGQWVPQPTVQPSVQAPTVTPDPQSDANIAPAAAGLESQQNRQPGQGQTAGEGIAGTVAGQAGAKTVPSPAQLVAPAKSSDGLTKLQNQFPGLPVGALPSPASLALPGASTPLVSQADDKTPASPENAAQGLPPQLGQAATGVAPTTGLMVDGTGTPVPTRILARGRPTELQAPEKIADLKLSGLPQTASGVKPSIGKEEKKSLTADSKDVAFTPMNVGTSAATREVVMPDSVPTKPLTDALLPVANDRLQSGGVSTATPTDAPFSAHAPKLVQEIRQIADRISSIDRNSVEVRFDFSDSARLSVRVEYRDGTVQTTFRTDSSQLRDAISHEWQTQGAANEQRPYRMAEPVFSQTSSDRQNFSSPGDGSGRQRAFDQPAAPSFSSTGRNAGSTTSVAVPAARSIRPETSLHLQAFA
jgi:hypothetical protein